MEDESAQDERGHNQALKEQIVFSAPVRVRFDPTSLAFEFVPPTVPMKGRGRVIFHRAGDNPQWKFVVGIVKQDSAEQFSSSVRAQGAILHIHDEFRELGTFEYKILVELNGQYHMSPDPVIVNEPP